jgi:hypothetical protein
VMRSALIVVASVAPIAKRGTRLPAAAIPADPANSRRLDSLSKITDTSPSSTCSL